MNVEDGRDRISLDGVADYADITVSDDDANAAATWSGTPENDGFCGSMLNRLSGRQTRRQSRAPSLRTSKVAQPRLCR